MPHLISSFECPVAMLSLYPDFRKQKPQRHLKFFKTTSLQIFLGGVLSYLTFFIEKTGQFVYVSHKGNSLSLWGQMVPLTGTFSLLGGQWYLDSPPPNLYSNINYRGFINLMGESKFVSTQVQARALHLFVCQGSWRPFDPLMVCPTPFWFFPQCFWTLFIR